MLAATSFEQLYKSHYRSLRIAAANIINDQDAAHDIVQEVFLKFWHRRNDLAQILNHKAYLYKSVVNASITYLSKNKSNVRMMDLMIESPGNPGSDLLAKELEYKIRSALENLPPKCRAVFVLSRYEDLRNKEIAGILGLSVKTVENQMTIALKKMKSDLRPYFPKNFMVFTAILTLFLQWLR
jgi:RNA polymerase sigma-70 factor (ECF subfamily)